MRKLLQFHQRRANCDFNEDHSQFSIKVDQAQLCQF